MNRHIYIAFASSSAFWGSDAFARGVIVSSQALVISAAVIVIICLFFPLELSLY